MEKLNDWDLEKIQNYLSQKIAESIEIESNDIDMGKLFSDYAIDSASGAALSGDIEEDFNLKLSPTLLFEYPTVEKLSNYLFKQVS